MTAVLAPEFVELSHSTQGPSISTTRPRSPRSMPVSRSDSFSKDRPLRRGSDSATALSFLNEPCSRLRSLSSSSLFPSPSSGFTIPPTLTTEEEASLRKLLRRHDQSRHQRDSHKHHDEKENLDRRNSSPANGSTKRVQAGQEINGSQFKARRRSSAAHPLSPANSTGRSRPNSYTGPSSLAQSTPASAVSSPITVSCGTTPAKRTVKARARPVSDFSAYLRPGVSSSTASPAHSWIRHSCSLQPKLSRNDSQSSLGSSVEPASEMHSPASGIGKLPDLQDGMSVSEDEHSTTRDATLAHRASSRSLRQRGNSQSDEPHSESEASDSTYPPYRPAQSGQLMESRSTSTLKPARENSVSMEDAAAASTSTEPVIIIRDFAFPVDDPRYKGLPPHPSAINIPNQGGQSWYQHTNSSAILSSSSSSSLSSSFTPPPFGSFGFGHQYHSPQQPTTGLHEWARWGMPQNGDESQNEADNAAGSSKYSWGFVTEQGGSSGNMSPFSMSRSASSDPNAANGDGLLPSALMGSALSIDEFDESDDEGQRHAGADDIQMDLASPGLAESGQSVSEDGSYPLEGLLYRAAYAFTAEAPQEMSLAEGDLVRVWEQLCDGWVVGGKVRIDAEGSEQELETGLIPQNYLVATQ